MDLWTFIFGLSSALVTLAPFMLWLSRRLRALSVFTDPRFKTFLDDWFGEAARPGFPARPGIPARLEAVEHLTQQLRPNGGSHLADKIARLVTQSDARATDEDLLARLDALLEQRAAVMFGSPGGPAAPAPS